MPHLLMGHNQQVVGVNFMPSWLNACNIVAVDLFSALYHPEPTLLPDYSEALLLSPPPYLSPDDYHLLQQAGVSLREQVPVIEAFRRQKVRPKLKPEDYLSVLLAVEKVLRRRKRKPVTRIDRSVETEGKVVSFRYPATGEELLGDRERRCEVVAMDVNGTSPPIRLTDRADLRIEVVAAYIAVAARHLSGDPSVFLSSSVELWHKETLLWISAEGISSFPHPFVGHLWA